MKIRFYHNGDNSVGIPGESIIVEVDAESSDNPIGYIEFLATCMIPGLTNFWDFPVKWEDVED